MVGAQQRGAGSLTLPIEPYREDGHMVMGDADGVAGLKRGAERLEPAGPGTCRGGEPRVVVTGLSWGVLAGWEPQRRCGAVGGGVDDAEGHRVLDIQPEVSGEDLAAGGRISDQPPGRRQVVEGIGDDLAEGVQVRPARGDHMRARAAGAGAVSHRGVWRAGGVSWPVTA